MHYKRRKKCGTIVVRTCSLTTPLFVCFNCIHFSFSLLSVARRCTAAGTHGIVAQLEERTAGTAADGRTQVRTLPMPPPSFFRFLGRGPHFFTACPSAVYDGYTPDGERYPTIRGGRSHLPSGTSSALLAMSTTKRLAHHSTARRVESPVGRERCFSDAEPSVVVSTMALIRGAK